MGAARHGPLSGQPVTKAELLEAAAKRLAEIVILLDAADEQKLALGAEDLQHQAEFAQEFPTQQ